MGVTELKTKAKEIHCAYICEQKEKKILQGIILIVKHFKIRDLNIIFKY